MKLAGNVVLDSARAIVTVPSSSGCRSTSSVRRLNSGSSSRNSTPLCDSDDFAGRRHRAAADQPGVADRVMRRAIGPRGQQRLPGAAANPSRYRCAWFRSIRWPVRSGMIVGTRLASIVLPEPGGPIISKLCPPAAAMVIARLAISWPRTSAKSTS